MEEFWKYFRQGEWVDSSPPTRGGVFSTRTYKFDHATYDAKLEAAIKGAKDLGDLIKRMEDVPPRPPWRPNAHYNEDGDMIEVYLNNEATYGVWLNPELTVLLSQETHEIVGMTIHGIKRLIKETRASAAKYEVPDKV